MTRPRLGVLTVMEELGGHHSVDDLVSQLADRGIRLPRTSVYGVVGALLDAELLHRADAGPGRCLYELPGDPHHHFVCDACGEIQDVPVSRRAPLRSEFPEVDGEVSDSRILFRGRCRQCLPTPSR